MISTNIYPREQNLSIIEARHINGDFSIPVQVGAVVVSILILVLTINVLWKVSSSKTTFINVLVILDCLNSAAHIPILLQFLMKVSGIESVCLLESGYNLVMTSMNRGIPVAISVYRYCCVFHDCIIRNPHTKWALQNLLLWFIAANSGINLAIFLKTPGSFQRYTMCMGREEVYEYNLEDFYTHKSFGPLTDLELLSTYRIMMSISYCLFICIVPFCYTKIFLFRKNHVKPGAGKNHEDQVRIRRRRNHVTYSSNMSVWLIETFSTIITGIFGILLHNSTADAVTKVVYIFITCGLTNLIYINEY